MEIPPFVPRAIAQRRLSNVSTASATEPAEKSSAPVDSVCLDCVSVDPKGPTRYPKDATGLQESLAELRSFFNREYYNESRDKQSRQTYYADVDWSASGDKLFAQLSEKVQSSHSKVLEYRPSKYVYPWVDLHPDGELRSIYSNAPMSAEKAIIEDWEVGQQMRRQAENALTFAAAAFSPEGAATAFATQEAAALNCEHVVPQSWFDKRQPERGDLHHLFACDSNCNSRRGNRPYDEYKMAHDDWRDRCGTIGPAGTFEPFGGKGTVARATLYFLLRYPGVVDNYDKKDLDLLLDWNRRYPPDLYEKHRNQAIEELQGNRNPLIDFPEMASKIDFTRGLK